MGGSVFGGGKSSGQGSQQAVLTPEQKELLGAQTKFLTGTAFPAYQETIGGAKQAYGQAAPAATTAAQTAMDVSGRAGALQEAGGTGAYLQGLSGLQNLFSPQYKQQQIQAALQPATEDIRDQMTQQGALYGGAGGLGSARQALASRNLASLGQARLGNIAAQVSGNVETQRQNAANALLGAGQAGLTAAQQSAASRIGFAQTPQDIYSKYASVIYGVPQQSTTPSFQGTQGTTSQGSSKSGGFRVA
jgi:hypothetical protein